MPNLKACLPLLDSKICLLQLHNMSMRWTPINILQKFLDALFASLSFSLNLALRSIAHPACDAVCLGLSAGEVPEVDTLNFTMHAEGDSLTHSDNTVIPDFPQAPDHLLS